MKKILNIGSGWEQLQLSKTIKNAGHSIIASHPLLNAEGFQYADHFYVKDSRDIAGHMRIAEAHNIDAIISDNCDFSFYTAAVIAAKLGLPFAPIESALFCNDKYEQRVRCAENRITQPDFQRVRLPEDLRKAATKIGFPLILKPVDSRGTFGVTISSNISELENSYYDAVHNSHGRVLICERFVPGTLVTVDGFCFSNGHHALTVASRRYEPGPKPVTKEIVYPGEFDNAMSEKLLANHEAVVKALGYRYGHTHGEYIINGEGDIFLVECTNRGGGVYTSSTIVPELTGLNLNSLLLQQSLGEDTFTIKKPPGGFMKKAVMLTFLDFEVGHVIKSINIEEMKSKPYTLQFRSVYGENDMVESVENCASRHSMLVLQGENRNKLQQNFAAFRDALRVQYYK